MPSAALHPSQIGANDASAPRAQADARADATQGLRYRDMMAVLFALLADSAQIGTTIITLGGDLLALPAQLVFSCFVSAILMAILGPRWQLLPAAALEFVPGANVLPTYTAATIWVLRKRLKEQRALTSGS